MGQVATEILQLGTYGVKFEELLAQFQIHLHEGGDDVDDLTSFFQVQGRGSYAFGHILDKGDQALEVTDDVALNGFGLVIILLRIRFKGDMGCKVGLFLGKLANSYALQALDNDLNSAIGHADHASDTRNCADSENVPGTRLFYLRRFLGYQYDQAITTHDIVNQADRALLAYAKRLHGKGINDCFFERQNR